MCQKVILSVMTGLLAVAISTGVATAGPVEDAQRLNAARDQVSRDKMNLGLEQRRKRQEINDFAKAVGENNLSSAVGNAVAIERENRVIQRQGNKLNGDLSKRRDAWDQLNTDFNPPGQVRPLIDRRGF
jgi:hypothetical protein